jgi:K+-transporting ATPase ATPase A chain
MTANSILQICIYLGVLLACVKPLGLYMASVYSGRTGMLQRVFGPTERLIYRICGVDESNEMNWRQYATAVLALSLASFVSVYLLQRAQGMLPLNPQSLPAVSADSSFNTAVSFTTNTNWQGYGGESTII